METRPNTASRRRRLLVTAAVTMALSAAFIPNMSAVGARAVTGHATSFGTLYRELKPLAASKSTLVVASPSDLVNLDPTTSSGDIYTQTTFTNMYSWLIDYKLGKSKGQQVGEANAFVGAIAKSFKIRHHYHGFPEVVQFFIRHGLKFANGDPLNADAVKFTYDRVFAQGGVTPFLLSTLSGIPNSGQIDEVNKYEVDFEMSVANKLLFGNMAQFGHSILDPVVIKAHETGDPYADKWLAAGNTGGGESGPYVLASWAPGNQWVLRANPHFYGPKPSIKTIIEKVVPDASTRLALLKSNAVDIAYGIATSDVAGLKKDKSVHVGIYPSRFVVFLGMNSNLAPFNNVKVREAIDYAVPYKTILKNVLHNYGVPLTSPIPLGTPTHTAKYDRYSTNDAKAKALLKAAHMPNGFTTTLQVAQGSQEGQEAAVWVEHALAKVGITVNIQQMPAATFTDQLQKHQLGFFFFNNWISINNDPFYHLFWLFHSPCCDYTNYNNPTINGLINKWTLSTDVKARDAAAV
ncbi:MAG TPA: ABC transporter substrate-binding protein, partial [Chloroflexota bacterium]|nr:ABC transporter substrate-binding protein [Chloroflexota bacterium]